ncbi:glycine transferase [Bacillus fungorum]|uniref:Glycine transferase n=2 Tax=Bacillus fungorum TaxID=2039284 RepID=A0A2G6QI40_9BACI|nr:glycine transferase [Bacillus fungorum]
MMKLGIMQPYFFPYIGYFQLIQHVDHWVVFDDIQFIRHGWINRNRILHPTEGWQYIIVPLEKHSHKGLIKNIKINNMTNWKSKIINQLVHYKKKAPYYTYCMEIVENALSINTNNITELNIHILKTICDYLEISFSYQISSQANFNYAEVTDAGEWALTISSQLNATEYINPISGKELFDPQKFSDQGIVLTFLQSKMEEIVYKQGHRSFEAGLSIIDLLMFCSKDEIKMILNQYEVL